VSGPLTTSTWRVSAAAALVVTATLGLAACGDDPQAGPAPVTPTVEATATEAASPSPTALAAADEALIAGIDALFTGIDPAGPGCTVAVGRNGQVLWAEGYGLANVETGEPMTATTVVDIGSTSKQFTATATLLLATRGELDLDASIDTYLDGLPPWGAEVTVSQLVHHTSGIVDYIDLLLTDGYAFEEVTTVEQTITALEAADELNFEPGTQFEYSNSNYFLQSLIVAAVTGTDLGSFLATEVFEPLGLDAVMDPTAVLEGKAESYAQGADGMWIDADSPWQQLGDGAIQTTPSELVTWSSEYLVPTLGAPAVDPAEFNRLRLVGAVADYLPGSVYGFGISAQTVDGDDYLSHPGGWGGFVTEFTLNVTTGAVVASTCNAPEVVPGGIGGDPSLGGIVK
jgi:CubicO group peptidase (beta-lactamase class C family)